MALTSAHNVPLVEEQQLQSRYADWKQRFDGSVMPELQKRHVFSPFWEWLWNDAWAEYDGLESIRIERGFVKQTWQNAVESQRTENDNFRRYKSVSETLTAYDWSHVPLGVLLEKYLGASISSGDTDAALALGRWRRFGEVVAERAEFHDSLSIPQKVSWTLLTQWWSATYQAPSLSNAAIASLEAAASSQVPLIHFFGNLYPDANTFAELRKSVYNSVMFDLFNHEFNPYHWEPYVREISINTLRQMRSGAIKHATAQRLGYTSYAIMKGYRVHDAGPYMGSLDMPCSWLPREIDQKELPFFLWDVEERRTVVVKDLNSEPEYCCVSHTWGRWRKEAIPINGVPWLVPQNEKFEVERLPEHLQQIQPRTRFIWIDLFCIPQDGSKKADDEINRQALIFQNASRCIAWINDVKQWNGTSKALDWLGISYLHATTSPGIYDTDTLLHAIGREAGTTSELLSAQTDPAEVKKRHAAGLLSASGPRSALSGEVDTLVEPACWFSSLWTLQEAMLCPDITFVAQDWISLKDKAGKAIPLDAFFIFMDIVDCVWLSGTPYKTFTGGGVLKYTKYGTLFNSSEHDHIKWPNGPRQLMDLCMITRMDNLLGSPSPIGLLIVANIRQCSDSRAPAIMAALGITDWYKSETKTDTRLVLKCYPLAFVKEAATKLGASFYESMARTPKQHDLFNLSHKGSMMPFSATNGWFSRILGVPGSNRYTSEDHPAVKTWKIKQDGSVNIRQVGIVASTENANANEFIMSFHISDQVKDLPKGACLYAVSLLRDAHRQYGLILEGYRKPWFSAQRLVKVCTFVFNGETDLPPTTSVDWVVW